MSAIPEFVGVNADTVVSPYLLSVKKRVFDVLIASMILLLLSPLLLVVIIALTSSGDGALYSQRRVGRNGKVFNCYKFRTMIPNAEGMLRVLIQFDPAIAKEWAETQKLKNDPRITRMGRFLRATSIDELPQLFNVIKGEMSIVGPRPFTEDQLAMYSRSAIQGYLQVAPGLTGPWQVYARNDTTFNTRSHYDSLYYSQASMMHDLKLMIVTPIAMLNGE